MNDLEDAHSLAKWLNWLELGACTCPFEWHSLGRLYEVSMGSGWVRMKDSLDCPFHSKEKK